MELPHSGRTGLGRQAGVTAVAATAVGIGNPPVPPPMT